MKMQINESPDELKGNQAGSKASGKRKKDVSYIEVEPFLPTYHMEDIEIGRVLKYLFDPDSSIPKKMVIQYRMGVSHLIDFNPRDVDDFSSVCNHPDTVDWWHLIRYLYNCDMDIDFTIRNLKFWGITKTSFGFRSDKVIDIKTLFEAFVKQDFDIGDPFIIKCDDEEIRIENILFQF